MNPRDEASAEQRSLLSDLSGIDPSSAAPAPAQAGSASRPRLTSQTIIIAAVLTISAGAIYAMRQYGMGAGMTFEVPAVSYEPDKNLAKLSEGQARILAELAMSTSLVQTAESIEKNPFRLDPDLAAMPLALDDGPITDDAIRRAIEAEKARLARLEMLQRSLGSMRLTGVLMGRVPLARVNEKTLRVGDTIHDFRVVEIREGGVSLEAEGTTFTLALDKDSR